MFATLTNRTHKKQTTVAEYKLFALKNNVPRNNSPDLAVAMQEHHQSNFNRLTV